MRKKVLTGLIAAQMKASDMLKDESGETNMIAIILIILAVIVLAGIFRTQLEQVLNGLFEQVKGALGIPKSGP